MTTLRPKVAGTLAKFLTSGEVVKACGRLRLPEAEKVGTMCLCLQGALCELYRRTRKRGHWKAGGSFALGYFKFDMNSPPEVDRWATGSRGGYPLLELDGRDLVDINDNGSFPMTFQQVAELLKKAKQAKQVKA
jgi:hypothetical protein